MDRSTPAQAIASPLLDLDSFAKLAPYLTHPLVLIGFVCLVVAGVFYAVLTSDKLPVASKTAAGVAILKILRYAFVIAILVILLGFGLVYLDRFNKVAELSRLNDQWRKHIVTLEQQHGVDQDTIRNLNSAYRDLQTRARGPNATPGIQEALQQLAAGHPEAAEAIFEDVVTHKTAEGAAAVKEAAEAARHLGALAFLSDIHKSLAAYRRAAELEPDHAWTKIMVGQLELRVGDADHALKAFQEGLASARAHNTRRDEAAALTEIGAVLFVQGNTLAAIAATKEALTIREQLLSEQPDSLLRQYDLSMSHEKIGDLQKAQGNVVAALASHRSALALRQRYCIRGPNSNDCQHDIAVGMNKVGDMLLIQGHRTEAVGTYGESLAISEGLVTRDPTNTEWERDLAVTYFLIGDATVDEADPSAKLHAYQQGMRVTEGLLAKDPANTEWQRDLATAYQRIGLELEHQGQLQEGLAAQETSKQIAERLVGQDPSNMIWRRDLAISYGSLGNSLRRIGDRKGALEAYSMSVQITEDISARDPSNLALQSDLTVGLAHIGDMLASARDFDGAICVYARGLNIAEQLAARDPTNLEWQMDLLSLNGKVAECFHNLQQFAMARFHYERAFSIASDLQSKDALGLSKKWVFRNLEQRLAAIDVAQQCGPGCP